MVLVGIYVALSKPLVAALPVLLLAWIRFGIGAVAMGHWLKKPADEAPATLQTKGLIFLESLLGNFLFSIFMHYGVSMTSAVSAGIILASIPAVVALMSWLFLNEKITLRIWLSVACAVIGIAIFTLFKATVTELPGSAQDAQKASHGAFWGNLLIFGAVLCESAYAVIGKRLTGVLKPKRIASLINLWGFALSTPFGIYLALDFDFRAISSSTWMLLLFYSLAASVWSVWLWMTGLKSVASAKAGIFTVMLPVSAALTGVVALGERLNSMQLLAFGIALLGVVLATLPPGKLLRRRSTKS